jgi:hypothetical protein
MDSEQHGENSNQASHGEQDPPLPEQPAPAGADHAATGADQAGNPARNPAGNPAEASDGTDVAATEGTTGKDGDEKKQQNVFWKRKEFWKKRSTQVGTTIGGLVIAALAGYLSTVLSTELGPAPSSSSGPIVGNPGLPPGRQDVSTMAPGKRFYAVPNFYEDQGCGRPCWLPLYQQPTEASADVTQGWPCEYYQQDQTSSSPTCVNPPAGRTAAEMVNPADKNSGDRVLVVCQVMGEVIRDDGGQTSPYWDMVAVPRSEISPDSTALGHLDQVPHMPGYYEAYGPDIWLGNTKGHDIPCA